MLKKFYLETNLVIEII